MTSTSKIFLGNVIVALLTAIFCVWFSADIEILFLTMPQLVSSVFDLSPLLGNMVITAVALAVLALVARILHAFVFQNHLISFFYQIPIPARN